MTKIQAHRGASAYAPENTLDAFKLAAEMGADGIEIDVHMSKDGEVVVCHDFETDRVAKMPGLIHDRTLAELKQIDFGAYFEGHGFAAIPTLHETLDFLKPTGLSLNIELKAGPVIYDGIEKRVLEIVAEHGIGDRVMYSSFNHYGLKMMKMMDPGAKIGLLYQSALFEPWRYAEYVGADAIHPYYITLLIPGIVGGCHGRGIAVNPWTVDSPEHMKMLYMLGVDSIITNKPDVAAAVRAGK